MTLSLVRAALTLLLLLTSACARQIVWTERVSPGCSTPTGDPQLDRERSYLAVVLALNDLRYAIVRSEPGQMVEAVFAGDYRPDVARTAWLVRVGEDGAYRVDVSSADHKTHKQSPRRYTQLVQYIAQYQCRTLDWLRWEAQNRGLAPVGPSLADVPPTATEGTQGPTNATSGDDIVARQRRIAELLDAREAIRVRRPAAIAAAGLFFLAVGASTLAQGIAYQLEGCDETVESCSPSAAQILMRTGGGALAGGAIVLGVALPITLQRVRRFRDLGRELKMLRTTKLTVTSQSGGLGMSLTGAF